MKKSAKKLDYIVAPLQRASVIIQRQFKTPAEFIEFVTWMQHHHNNHGKEPASHTFFFGDLIRDVGLLWFKKGIPGILEGLKKMQCDSHANPLYESFCTATASYHMFLADSGPTYSCERDTGGYNALHKVMHLIEEYETNLKNDSNKSQNV